MALEILEAYGRLDDVRALFSEYQASLGVDLGFQQFDEELRGLPGRYARPDGRLYLALSDGEPAGCACLRRFDETRCEMKRLYVRDRFRGLKLGRALAEKVIEDARSAGYRQVLLDTLPTMTGAQALYERLGFAEIPAYRFNPVEGTRYMALTL